MKLYLLLLVTTIISSECHKILVYIPQMGYSHMNFLGHLADSLVKAGHDVVGLIFT
ncbi:unnamed protein product [Anisakis simplex]|uniref:Glucuronosyltransferase n=1 Tax=Anisakis simplex TaxID=6269 RepID=A0A0M3JHA3_ANISI|nr:unnamed protein product [Anisakis simplex]